MLVYRLSAMNGLKDSTWAPYEQAKTVLQNVFTKIFVKKMCP